MADPRLLDPDTSRAVTRALTKLCVVVGDPGNVFVGEELATLNAAIDVLTSRLADHCEVWGDEPYATD